MKDKLHSGATGERDKDFASFTAHMSPRLVMMGQIVTGDAQRGEDLAQSALMGVYERWGRLDDPAAYARRCVLNGHRSWWRRRSSRETLPGDLPELQAVPDLADAALRRQCVTAALSALTHRERTVVVLRYLDDLSEAQTAAELSISPGTVKSTASRALAKLRVHPALHDDEPNPQNSDRTTR